MKVQECFEVVLFEGWDGSTPEWKDVIIEAKASAREIAINRSISSYTITFLDFRIELDSKHTHYIYQFEFKS